MVESQQGTRKTKHKERRRQDKRKSRLKISFITISVMMLLLITLFPNFFFQWAVKPLQSEDIVAAETVQISSKLVDKAKGINKTTRSTVNSSQTVYEATSKNAIIVNHKVKKAETIFSISKLYYGSNNTAEILAYNGITKPEEEVKQGMMLAIPNPDVINTHIVKKGETLFNITIQYFSRQQLLTFIMNYNGIKDPSKDVKVGMTVYVPSNQSVISHRVKEKETLYSIMTKYYSLADFQKRIADFNDIHNVTTDIKIDMELKIPNVFNGDMGKSNQFIEIDTIENVLSYYKNNKLIFTTKVATGKNDLTPKGTFEIITKFKDPSYSPKKIASGAPNNPLGTRWLGLNVEGTQGRTYGIHGTNSPSSIGFNVSMGCIRLENSKVEWLFDQVPKGTKVIIK